jgi:hypothetical protein
VAFTRKEKFNFFGSYYWRLGHMNAVTKDGPLSVQTESVVDAAVETIDTETLALPEISQPALAALVRDIDMFGFGKIERYLAADRLAKLQSFVQASVDAAGGEYVGFSGKEAVRGSVLDALSDPGEFENLLHRVYQVGTGKAPPGQPLYQVLRCLKGQSGLKHSLIFHYDSYVVTALLPIIIPSSGSAGHLVMVPNFRPVRSTYIRNAVDKLLLDNKLTQWIMGAGFRRGLFGLKQVPMVPGNLYLFWGYRTVHANEACDPDQIRATALFHYADPHAGSVLRNLTRKAAARAAGNGS